MTVMGVNLLAVLASGVATMILGFVWYSPLLFAKPWTKLMGYDLENKAQMDEMRKGAGKLYGISFLTSLLTALLLGKVIHIATVDTALYGMKVGAGMWLGFVATVQLTDALFMRKPVQLFLINTGYRLVCCLAMGAILAVWPR